MRVSGLLLFLAVAAYSQSGQSTGCRTELGISCYTIHANLTEWQIFFPGSRDLARHTFSYVHAQRSDGSVISITDGSGSKTSRAYLAPERRIVTIDYDKKTIAAREPLIWHDLPYRRSTPHDNTCQTGIRHSGTDFTMQGTTKVAGVEVVKWYRTLGNGGYEEQYLAPSLDCLSLKSYSIRKNSWGLPKLISSAEATSVDFGAPSPELFALPTGYRQVEDPQRAVLLKMSHGR